MNEFDDLDELERELGPSLRVALRRAAAGITGEPRLEAHGPRRSGPVATSRRIDDTTVLLDNTGDHALEHTSTDALVVDIQPTGRTRTARTRWLLAAAAVAAAVLLIAGTVFVQQTGSPHIRTKPAGPSPTPTEVTPPTTIPGDGSVEGSLLPEGTPSNPQTGELVASVAYFDEFNETGGSYFLYADGHLISVIDGKSFVRRLTPEGVERVRSEFLATGLFDDPDRPPTEVQSRGEVPFCLCVREGGRLLAAPQQDSGFETAPLVRYLRTLGTSLPSHEWADQTNQTFVPSRIAVCVQTYVNQSGAPPVPLDSVVAGVIQVPTDLSILLPLFPQRAAELLNGREALGHIDSNREGATCFEMTLQEARTLADAFLDPSGGGVHQYWGIVIRFNSQFDATQQEMITGNAAYITFDALLPDGLSATAGG